jgi:Zn-finger in ubiquitin-hydrolases and other protein/SnoaL-like polyketide cyclase
MVSLHDSGIPAFAAALVAGDLAGVRSFLADDYFGHPRAPGEPSQADRWTGLLPAVRTAMPDLRIDLEEALLADAAPEDVGVRAVVTGTHARELWGSPGTGRSFRAELALRFRRADGAWLVQGEDPPSTVIAALRAVGVIPPADAMHIEPKDPISPPDFLLKLGFTGRAADKPCPHLADASVFEPSTAVCAECVALDGFWPALRMCLVCGHIGCCDTSVNKHARAHFEATGHPIMRSVRLQEAWIWCYPDGALFERRTLAALAEAAGSPLREG